MKTNNYQDEITSITRRDEKTVEKFMMLAVLGEELANMVVAREFYIDQGKPRTPWNNIVDKAKEFKKVQGNK